MAFSRFASSPAVDAGRGASAAKVCMTRRIRALTMVLLMRVGSTANRADDHVSPAEVARGVVQGPIPLALLNEQAGKELMDTGLTPEHERRVAEHVLKMQSVLIKECKGNGTETVLRGPGRQPVRFPKDDEVFHDLVAGEFPTQSLRGGKGVASGFPHRRNKVHGHTCVAP